MSVFYPHYSLITDISRAQQCVVTFDEDHDFTDGEVVSLRSSRPYGMYEVQDKQALVLSHTDDTVTLDLDTQAFNAFVYPPVGDVMIPAMAVPAGSGIIPNSNPATVNLEDAFDNRPE